MQEMEETQIASLGREDPLEEAWATHSSVLAWKTPTDRGAWRAAVHGITRGRHSEGLNHSNLRSKAVCSDVVSSLP